MFTMCSFFNELFTVTDKNNTMHSKNRISLIESKEFRETLTVCTPS